MFDSINDTMETNDAMESAARTMLAELVKAGLRVSYTSWTGYYGKDEDFDWVLVWDPNNRLTEPVLNKRTWRFVGERAHDRYKEEGIVNVEKLSNRDVSFVLGLLNNITCTIDGEDQHNETKPQRAVVQFLNVALDLGLIPPGPELRRPAADEFEAYIEDSEIITIRVAGKALIRDDVVARQCDLAPSERNKIHPNIYTVQVPSSTEVLNIRFGNTTGSLYQEKIRLSEHEDDDSPLVLDNVIIGDYSDDDIRLLKEEILKTRNMKENDIRLLKEEILKAGSMMEKRDM